MNLRYAEEKNERGIALHPFVHPYFNTWSEMTDIR